MPTLYVLSGPQIGRSFELVDGTVIGRAPTCAKELGVALRDSSVSRNHARVEREGTKWFIADMGSSNGVHFAGLRVQREELTDQAEFNLGELELRVRIEAAPTLAKAKLAPAKPKLAPVAFEEDEIELEEEIELEPEPVKPPPPAPKAAASPPQPTLSQTRLTRPASSEEPVMKRKILQYNRVENRSGIFSTDMSQWPPYVQFLMVIFAAAVVGGLGYGAFLAAQIMRGG